MEPTDQPPAARRSAGEWLFQLTTITIGVLIALSFDALLRWNDDRTLVAEARANIAREIEDNRRELEAHLATYEERVDRLDNVLKLLAAQEAGVAPTTGQMLFNMEFPSLNDAGWRTAQQTGALALMDYGDVQRVAETYALQALVAENLKPLLLIGNQAGSIVETASDPLALPPPMRDSLRGLTAELRGIVRVDEQLGRQLLAGYDEYLGADE
jgi:hypothetical protein